MKQIHSGLLVMALMVLGFQAGTAEGSSAGGGNPAQKSKALPMQPPPAAKPAGDPETLAVEVANQIPPVDRDNLKAYWPVVEDRTKAQWMHGLPALREAAATGGRRSEGHLLGPYGWAGDERGRRAVFGESGSGQGRAGGDHGFGSLRPFSVWNCGRAG